MVKTVCVTVTKGYTVKVSNLQPRRSCGPQSSWLWSLRVTALQCNFVFVFDDMLLRGGSGGEVKSKAAYVP